MPLASELSLFLRRLALAPKQVSAMAPSSRFLARAMAEGLGPKTGRVVEFGPGTGRLTRGILDAGVPASSLTVFELDPAFVGHLHRTFPGVTVHATGADTAPGHVTGDVGAVVSGLPLLSMPPAVREAIVGAAFRILAPGGVYIQFTYGPRPPVPDDIIERLGLTVEAGRKIWANLPPARVYRFRRH
jgi:phosphatidylethanolamine/phosphatidyl-N-methylethanolamine N-methyltransferase